MSLSMCDDCKYVRYSFDGGSTKCGYRGKKDCNFIPREKKDLTKDKDINTARKIIIKSEAIKEFANKINELLARYSHLHTNAENARQDTIEAVDGTDIEMQSVWDVFTLKNNEMAEYEEMNRLQKNIEAIAEERLLKEIEKDFRLLVKEMTEE